MRLLSVLSNFEPLQLEVKRVSSLSEVEHRESRAELQKQAKRLRQVLVDRYRAGATVKALAVEFELHHQTVRAALVDAGVAVRTRRRLADGELAQARELYEAGQTTTEIGDAFGVYASTVGRALVRLGVVLRPPGRPLPD